MATRKLGPAAALTAGAGEAWQLTTRVLAMVPRLPALVVDGLGRMVTGREAPEEGLGGPLRMAEMFGEAARWGVVAFLIMLANISTQLAIFNLLPIPVLDGGHLALHLVEFVTRRPPSLRVRIVLQQIGFASFATAEERRRYEVRQPAAGAGWALDPAPGVHAWGIAERRDDCCATAFVYCRDAQPVPRFDAAAAAADVARMPWETAPPHELALAAL